jgi:anaerobic ribonucleoside-triphosphate reductase
MICEICEKEINREYLQANTDDSLKPTVNGAIVCSTECAEKYREKIKYGGDAIQHWSRITGYYQNVSGWNKGKLAELHDRKRFDV